MPIEFKTSEACDLVYARWSGIVDFCQFEANFALYTRDRLYCPGRPELIDVSAVTEFAISPTQLRTLLRHVNAQTPAVIVETHTVIYSPDETLFGVGRMYQTFAELTRGIRVEVFREQGAALRALGMAQDSIADLLDHMPFEPPHPYEP